MERMCFVKTDDKSHAEKIRVLTRFMRWKQAKLDDKLFWLPPEGNRVLVSAWDPFRFGDDMRLVLLALVGAGLGAEWGLEVAIAVNGIDGRAHRWESAADVAAASPYHQAMAAVKVIKSHRG